MNRWLCWGAGGSCALSSFRSSRRGPFTGRQRCRGPCYEVPSTGNALPEDARVAPELPLVAAGSRASGPSGPPGSPPLLSWVSPAHSAASMHAACRLAARGALTSGGVGSESSRPGAACDRPPWELGPAGCSLESPRPCADSRLRDSAGLVSSDMLPEGSRSRAVVTSSSFPALAPASSGPGSDSVGRRC